MAFYSRTCGERGEKSLWVTFEESVILVIVEKSFGEKYGL